VLAYAHKDTIAANEEKSASCLDILDSAGVGNNRQTESDFQGEEPEYNSSRMVVTVQAVDGNKEFPAPLAP